MLHAFLAGVFHPGDAITGNGAFFSRDPASSPDKYSGLGSDWGGAEIWAYIPQNLLPHLKWLPDPDYANINHVYFVDLKPRVFDARIYEDADTAGHPLKALWDNMSSDQKDDRVHGWCTVLVGGMRFGGGEITVTGDFDNDTNTAETTRAFTSSYFAIDVTDPLHPILLWEKNYTGLGFTTSFPAVLKVDKRQIDTGPDPDVVNVLERHWYLLFGSGPTDYDGTSTQSSSIFLVDMATGRTDVGDNPGRIFTKLTNSDGTDSATLLPANGFMAPPVSVDLTIDYSVNVSYLGESHESGGTYDGGLYRLQVPVDVGTANGKPVLLYKVNPQEWTLTHMFDADYAITAAPAVAVGTVDSNYSLWVYFGTGRYLANADKSDFTQEYLYGIKDPHYNFKLDESQRNTLLGEEPLTKSWLFETSGVRVYTDGSTSTGTDFGELKTQQQFGQSLASGWFRSLELSGERIINKPSTLGGILMAPSFVPNSDICGFGGDSYLNTLYFETGTAYVKSVIGVEADGTKDRVLDKKDLGAGLSSSLGIHIGREHGARGFVQQSTGTISQINLQPAFSVKSGFINWREIR
jgi:type IV pilus assembly protein PilY1